MQSQRRHERGKKYMNRQKIYKIYYAKSQNVFSPQLLATRIYQRKRNNFRMKFNTHLSQSLKSTVIEMIFSEFSKKNLVKLTFFFARETEKHTSARNVKLVRE